MTKNNEGRSHWGLVITIAVLAVVCLVVLVANGYLNKGKNQECMVTREEILHECDIRQGEASITDSLDDAAVRALELVMIDRRGVPVGKYQYRNICISGGVLTYDRNAGELYCSVHGRNGMSQEEAAKKAAEADLPTLFEAAEGETVIDSTKPGSLTTGKISALRRYDWAVSNWSSGQYEIFLTDADVEDLQPGSSIFVTVYHTLTEEAETGTVEITYKITKNQGRKVSYHVMDLETFEPLDL